MAYFEVTYPSDRTSFTVWIRESSSISYNYFIVVLEKLNDYSGSYQFFGRYEFTGTSKTFTNSDIPTGAYQIRVAYNDGGTLELAINTKNGQSTTSAIISSGGDQPTGDSTFEAEVETRAGNVYITIKNDGNLVKFLYQLYNVDPSPGGAVPIQSSSPNQTLLYYSFTGLTNGKYWLAVWGWDSSDMQYPIYGKVLSGNYQQYVPFEIDDGGGTSKPTFSANISGSNTIQVLVSDPSNTISGYCTVYFGNTIKDAYLSSNQVKLYSNLGAGTYVISISANVSGSTQQLKTRTGLDIVTIVIEEEPQPQYWNYNDVTGTINISSISLIQANYSGTKRNGRKFIIYFNQAGTLRLWSTNISGGLLSYAETEDNGYDEETGKPYGSGNATIGSFDYSLYCPQGTYLYLWVNSDSTEYGYYLNANFTIAPTPVTVPSYAFSINGNKITFNVSNKGDFYLSYIARLWDDQDDRSYTNYYTTSTSATTGSLLYNTKYAVNVGYSTEINGVITWIEKREAQIGSEKEPFNYSLISGISISDSNPNPKRISFNRNTGVIVPITISYRGIITIYTETDQSIVMNDIAYLCDSSNKSYSSLTGEVYDYIDYDDDSHGNGEFQITINNTDPNLETQVYYLYIRGLVDLEDDNTPRAINTLLYAIIPEEECVWIYTGISTNGGWQKAIPYIYTGSGSENGWQKAIPYIYTGSGSENGWQKAIE